MPTRPPLRPTDRTRRYGHRPRVRTRPPPTLLPPTQPRRVPWMKAMTVGIPPDGHDSPRHDRRQPSSAGRRRVRMHAYPWRPDRPSRRRPVRDSVGRSRKRPTSLLMRLCVQRRPFFGGRRKSLVRGMDRHHGGPSRRRVSLPPKPLATPLPARSARRPTVPSSKMPTTARRARL